MPPATSKNQVEKINKILKPNKTTNGNGLSSRLRSGKAINKLNRRPQVQNAARKIVTRSRRQAVKDNGVIRKIYLSDDKNSQVFNNGVFGPKQPTDGLPYSDRKREVLQGGRKKILSKNTQNLTRADIPSKRGDTATTTTTTTWKNHSEKVIKGECKGNKGTVQAAKVAKAKEEEKCPTCAYVDSVEKSRIHNGKNSKDQGFSKVEVPKPEVRSKIGLDKVGKTEKVKVRIEPIVGDCDVDDAKHSRCAIGKKMKSAVFGVSGIGGKANYACQTSSSSTGVVDKAAVSTTATRSKLKNNFGKSMTKCKSSSSVKMDARAKDRLKHGKRLASLNATAMVHMIYESDILGDDRSTSGESDCGNRIKSSAKQHVLKKKPVSLGKRKKVDQFNEDGIIDTRFCKRVANLNAQAIMAASCSPPKKRLYKKKSVERDANNNKGDARVGYVMNSDCGSPSEEVIDVDDDDVVIVNETKLDVMEPEVTCILHDRVPPCPQVAPNDELIADGNSISKNNPVVYDSPPPPYHAIGKPANINRDYCLSPSVPHTPSYISNGDDQDVEYSSYCHRQQGHQINARRQSRQDRRTIRAVQTQEVTKPFISGSVIGAPQYGDQYRGNLSSFHGQHHSSNVAPYSHNFYQPAGPLLQAVPDHFNMIHKPVPYHPQHHQFSDLSAMAAAAAAAAGHTSAHYLADGCHNMPALHSLPQCIPEKCQTIHHVSQSPTYNQISSNEVPPSMPPRLQPLRTAQQQLNLNKNDAYSYPPPPILSQPQFNACPPFSRPYQPQVIAEFQPMQNYSTSISIHRDGYVSVNPACNVPKAESMPSANSSSELIKQYQCKSHQQPIMPPLTKVTEPRKLISQQPSINTQPKKIVASEKSVKHENFNSGQSKGHSVLRLTDVQSHPNSNLHYSCSSGDRTGHFIKIQNNKPPQIERPQLNAATQKIRTQPMKKAKTKNEVNEQKISENKNIFSQNVSKKKTFVIKSKESEIKIKKSESVKNNKVGDKIENVSSLISDVRCIFTKNKKVKRLCEGWSWSGEAKKKQIFMNNEDSPVLRTTYPAMQHVEGDIIRERDSVLVCSGSRKTDIPFVAKISALWENLSDGEMMMSILWYYRPEQTDHGRKPHHMEQEIFASKHRDNNSVACIEDKCYVITYAEYCRYRAEVRRQELGYRLKLAVVPSPEGGYEREKRIPSTNVSSDRIFFCRKVYDYRQKRCLKNPV